MTRRLENHEMPEQHELRRLALKAAYGFEDFRNLVIAVGYTVEREEEMPDGQGIRIYTKEGPLPTWCHSGRWYVQGKNAAECEAKLRGEVTDTKGIPPVLTVRAEQSWPQANGVVVVRDALKNTAEDLCKLLRGLRLDPVVLAGSRQLWTGVLEAADFYRAKTWVAVVVATPRELERPGMVRDALSFVVGMLGVSRVLLLVQDEEYERSKHLPQGTELLAFEDLEDVADELVKALYRRADRPLRLIMSDEAAPLVREAFARKRQA